jgi:hypothetical protein
MKEKEIETILSDEHLDPAWVKEKAKKIDSLYPTLNRDKVKTAREILLNQRNGDDKPITAALHPEGWVFKMILRAMEEYAQQSTLNRDKVMEVLVAKSQWIESHSESAVFEGKFRELADALCSLSLPTLSEDDIRQLWYFHANVGKDGEYMTEENFNAALNELTKPKEEE